MASEAIEEALAPRARESDVEIGTDASRLDLDMIHGFLAGSYWAALAVLRGVSRRPSGRLRAGHLRSRDLCLRQRRVRAAVGARPGRGRPAHGGHHGASRSAGPPAMDALHARCARAVPALRVRRCALPRSADGGLDGPVHACPLTPLVPRRGPRRPPPSLPQKPDCAGKAGARTAVTPPTRS
jgi:hypothetical protein